MTIIAPAQQASTAITRTPETAAALDRDHPSDNTRQPRWGTGFAMVPGWLLATRPSGTAVLVYAHLAMHGTYNPGTATYEQCRPSARTLAYGDPRRGYPGTGLSIKTIRRALDELEALGAIVGEAAYDERGARLPNVYRLQFGQVTPPPGGVVTSDQGGWSPATRGGGHQRPGGVVTSDHQPITNHPDPSTHTSTTRARAREGTADSQVVVVEGEIISTTDIDTAVDGGGHPPVDQDDRTDSHHATAVALVDALPPIGDARPNGTLRRHLVRGVAARLAGGWTSDALGAELAADLAGAHSPGVYRARLDALPDRPPQRPASVDGWSDRQLRELFGGGGGGGGGGGDSQRRSSGRPPWCGDCDERTRMLPVDDMRVTRCPTCHPLAVRAAAV